MTRHIRAMSVLLCLLFLLAAPRIASAYLVFSQNPPNETYNGAMLDSPYHFISFGCTLSLDCGVAGETVYRVGVWMQKVGSPKDVRLDVVGDWQDISGTSAVASTPVSADTIPNDAYTLVWFDFPEGVVIGERGANNQFFQFQFADAPGMYDAANHYRVLFHETSDFSGPAQWCKKYSGCFSSQFYWQMDAGPVPQAPDQFYATTTASGTEQYADHFDADPSWNTDQPEHFSWDSARHELRAHMENTPPAYQPNRYFIKELDIDPTQSFSISADLMLEDARGGNGAILFGLFADDFTHENLTPTNGPRIYSKSTLNLKLMSLGGGNRFFELNAIGQDSVQQGGGGSGPSFRRYRWYTFYLRYDAETKHVYGTVIDTKTGLPYISLDADMPAGFSPDMRYLGVSMHPDGEFHSTMAGSEQRLAGASDFRIDNVRVFGTASTTPTPACCSNIFFIPGIQASRLYLDENGNENRLWEPNWRTDIKKLFFDKNGESVTQGIYTKDTIDAVFGRSDIYGEFTTSLDGLVTDGTIADWQAFPYDWRKSAEDVVESGTSIKVGDDVQVVYMADELLNLATTSKSGKVTILGHSNGGIVGKLLIDELVRRGHADLVDTFIMVATPQLGTPKALASLLHGDEQSIPWEHFGVVMDKSMARDFAETMPGGYALIPSARYISSVSEPVIEFDPDVAEIYDFPSLYGDSIDTQSELQEFLTGDNGGRAKPSEEDTDSPNVLDKTLVGEAYTLHRHLDSWTAPEGIEVIQIVGWGLDTIRGIRYDDCDILLCPDNLGNLDRELLLDTEGDGTVVAESASAATGMETYYLKLHAYNDGTGENRDHADFLGAKPVQELIKNFVQNGTSTLPTYVSPEKPSDTSDERLRFRIHSPVSLDLYDTKGRHTGILPPAPDSDLMRIEAEIPNSYYREFGEVKYAGAGSGEPVGVVLIGQDTGTFTLEIEEIRGDAVQETSVFTDIPVVENARASVENVGGTAPPSLSLDMDNDGVNDASIAPGEGLTSQELIGILRGLIWTLDLPVEKQKKLDKIFDTIDKTLIKDQKCVAHAKAKCEHNTKHKTDQAFAKLSQSIQKLSRDKKDAVSSEDVTDILALINLVKTNLKI